MFYHLMTKHTQSGLVLFPFSWWLTAFLSLSSYSAFLLCSVGDLTQQKLIKIIMMIQTGHRNLLFSLSCLLVSFFLPSPSTLSSSSFSIPSPTPPFAPLSFLPSPPSPFLFPFLPTLSLPFLSSPSSLFPSSFLPFLHNSLPSLLSFLPSLPPN